MARLGDVVRIEASSKQVTGDKFWLLNLDMVEQQTGNVIDYNYVGRDALNGSIIQFDTDCVLYSKLRPNLNKVVLPNQDGFATSEMLPLRPDTKVLKKEYLTVFLRSESFVTWAVSKTAGAKMPRLGTKELLSKEIPLPSISEQTRIAEQLAKIDELIALRKEQLAKLDQLVKSRFIELFGEPMTNSHGYALKKYGDLFELNAGGTPSRQKPEYWENGTISWIGSNMCQNIVLYENDGNHITEEGLKHSSAKLFPIDTVLIALVGATIGKTALLKFETTTNQNVLGVRRIRENGYTPEFIFYYTQGLYQKFLSIGDGGFAMASKGFISELPVPVVDLVLQEQFSAFVKQTDKSKLAIQQSLDKLELLKKSLMQEYFG